MPKRAVSARIISKHLTKAEKAARLQTENKFPAELAKLKPLKLLNSSQRKIFKELVKGLADTGMLSNLDIDIFNQAAITIDRMRQVDESINKITDLLDIPKLLDIKDQLFRQYLKICAELCLSPQARAKMGTLIVNNRKEEKDPLMRVLNDA